MAEGHSNTEKKEGHSVRISHAKAHAVLQGKLIVRDDLSPILAQGLFAEPGTYDVVIRMSSAPGEILDDSKVNATRGMAVKVFDVEGPKVPGHTENTQDFVFTPGRFSLHQQQRPFCRHSSPMRSLHRSFRTRPRAWCRACREEPMLLNMFGIDSAKLDFFGHKIVLPLGKSNTHKLHFVTVTTSARCELSLIVRA